MTRRIRFRAPPHPPGIAMPSKKKEGISADVGPVNHGRKSGNPDFVSSSFYCPRRINARFNSAINTLKAEGFDVDRSDLLSVFMDRFATAVRQCEDAGDEMDLQAILSKAADQGQRDVADVSAYKEQYRKSVEALQADHDEKLREIQVVLKKASDLQEKATEVYSFSRQDD